MMRIAIDLDGTLAEGRHIAAPDDPRQYLELGPYDHDAAQVWNELTRTHVVTLLTARHHHDALGLIRTWLTSNFMRMPASIITHAAPETKSTIAKALGCTHLFDDSPVAIINAHTAGLEAWLMHNEGWQANRQADFARRCCSWSELYRIVRQYEAQ